MTEPHFSKQKSSCSFTAVSRHSTCRHFFREICVFQNRMSDAKELGVDPEMLSTDSYLTNFTENSPCLWSKTEQSKQPEGTRFPRRAVYPCPEQSVQQRPTCFTLDHHEKHFHITVRLDISPECPILAVQSIQCGFTGKELLWTFVL